MNLKTVLKGWRKKHLSLYRFLTFSQARIHVSGHGNKVVNKALSLKGTILKIKGDYNQVEFGEECILRDVSISITGNNHKLLFENDTCFLEGGRIRMEDSGNELKVASGSCIISAFFSLSDTDTAITIGKNCLISSSVIFRTSDSHSVIQNKKRINPGRSIVIGEHVWIGNGANILKGVSIGENAIVGTQSVVTKDVPAGTIVCGNPAKIVKSNITWYNERIR